MTQEEFRNLFDAYFEDVRRFIYYRSGDTEMATEVGQETFLRIWDKQITPQKGKEIALLFKIASNIFISNIRKNQSAQNYRKSMVMRNETENPSDRLEYKELKLQYEAALRSLNEKQRTVFLMSRLEELSYQEMAKRLDISIKTVEKRMSQALSTLRKALL